jgi:hypothetical protein
MSNPICECGCGQLVNLRHKQWNRFATRRCYLKSLTPAQRRENSLAWLARDPNARAVLSENGAKGGRAVCPERWTNLLEKWQDLSPREALQAAFYDGYGYGWRAKQRARRGERREQGAA